MKTNKTEEWQASRINHLLYSPHTKTQTPILPGHHQMRNIPNPKINMKKRDGFYPTVECTVQQPLLTTGHSTPQIHGLSLPCLRITN